MNYYNRYPSHYLSKTLLLSMEQDGAYTRLMDWYYAEEKAIPHDKRYIVARCQSSKEKAAVDFVLTEFFLRRGDVWVQERIEKELDKAAPKIEAARENGKRGGRPRKEKPNGFPENNPMGFQKETQQEPSAKAPQTPYPNNQKLPTTSGDDAPPADRIFGHGVSFLVAKGVKERGARSFLGAMRKELGDDMLVVELLVQAEKDDVCDPLAWLRAAGRSRLEKRAAGPPGGRPQTTGKQVQAIQNLEAMKYGGLDPTGDSYGLPETGVLRLGAEAGS